MNGCLGRVVSHEGARAMVRMDGPGGRVGGVLPANLVVVVDGLLYLLENLSDVFAAEVLQRLGAADRAVLAPVGKCFLAAERGPGRKPGASLYTRKRLSLSQGPGQKPGASSYTRKRLSLSQGPG